MKIPENPPLQATSAGDRPSDDSAQTVITATGGRTKADTRDTVSLTEKGREYRSAVHQAQMLPDVRMDRVTALRRQLADGTYRVEGDRVASSMMDETVENNTVLKHIDLKA